MVWSTNQPTYHLTIAVNDRQTVLSNKRVIFSEALPILFFNFDNSIWMRQLVCSQFIDLVHLMCRTWH